MKLARTIHFDDSDFNVFARPAETGEWAISGGFEFSNWTEGDLVGKARQAFANGWLGLESYGRATFVAVVKIEIAEIEALKDKLAQHFVDIYGAPSLEAARSVAAQELEYMCELAEDQEPNAILVVQRELTESGVKESFRSIKAQDADLDQIGVHVTEE